NCREGNGRSRVPADGFGEDTLARGDRQLLFECGGLLSVGDAPDTVGRNERTQALDGLLQHSLLAHDFEELLGSTPAAAWPEARAAPSCKDNGVGREFFSRHRARAKNLTQRPWRTQSAQGRGQINQRRFAKWLPEKRLPRSSVSLRQVDRGHRCG